MYDKDAWYAKWQNWALAFICLIFPFFIMISVFILQISANVAAKLEVPGKEIYLSPYIWLILCIIPIFGWILLSVMIIYIQIWSLVMLYRGYGEKYID